MNIGFMIGCFISIVFWGIDREKALESILQKSNSKLTYKVIRAMHILLIGAISWGVFYIEMYIAVENKLLEEVLGLIVGILVIDMSNADKKSIKIKEEKKYFCDTISLVSRGITCGFIGPILYVNLVGMYFALMYSMLNHYIVLNKRSRIKYLGNLVNIIPSMLTMICLYIVYVVKYKKLCLSFNGDFLKNMVLNPLLNVDILGAYVQGVGFYAYNEESVTFMKRYGKVQRKIDRECVVNYISLAYIICLVVFVGALLFLEIGKV